MNDTTAQHANERRIEMWTCNLPRFKEKICKLNKILKRHGRPLFTWETENVRLVPITFQFHCKGESSASDSYVTRQVEVCDVIVSNWRTEIKKDDKTYVFLGTVKFENGIKQVFCKDEAYAHFFTDGFRNGQCDHCHVKNERRLAYYLFAVDGEVVQIGSTCAQEYLGINSLDFLLCQEETFICFHDGCDEDGNPSFRHGSVGVPYEEVYSYIDYATRGFTKWNKSNGGYYCPSDPLQDWPTREAVNALINIAHDPSQSLPEFANRTENVTREECIAYWESQPFSTFQQNCLEALSVGHTTKLSLGAYCYAVFGAVNHVLKVKANKASDDSVPCPFEIGKRVKLTGSVVSVRVYEDENVFSPRGGYVTKYAVTFKSDEKYLFHFTTSSKTFRSIETNDRVEVTGTVEAAKPYNGVNYTRLSRPKCLILTEKEVA